MEEDIKVLEEIINSIDFNNEYQVFVLGINQIELIQNLIKGYKEIEEENIKLHTEIAEVVYWESSSVEQIKQDYIPKSKVREKIEELEKIIQKEEEETCGRCITIGKWEAIKYLQELLEERN